MVTCVMTTFKMVTFLIGLGFGAAFGAALGLLSLQGAQYELKGAVQKDYKQLKRSGDLKRVNKLVNEFLKDPTNSKYVESNRQRLEEDEYISNVFKRAESRLKELNISKIQTKVSENNLIVNDHDDGIGLNL